MPFVIVVDGIQRAGRLCRRRETKHALPVGKKFARTAVLHDDRLAAGKITDTPIADPAGLQADARWFRATELAPRLLDVSLIGFRRSRDISRMPDAPA